VPTGELQFIDIPPTMKVWMCEREHYFERDARGRLVQRTPEYIYRKIIREWAKIRKIPAPPPVAPPYVPPPAVPPRPIRLQDVWWTWLEREKGITREEFMKLSKAEKNRLRSEFGAWYAGTLGR